MATDSILRPGELKNLLLKEIQAADLADIDVREVGTVLEVKDGIAPDLRPHVRHEHLIT